MPEIEVRPATASDIPTLISLDHNYTTEYAWQMSFQSEHGEGQSINFRRIRLPRPVKVEYPRSPNSLSKSWNQRSAILIALFNKQAIGYVSLWLNKLPSNTWITDLVVSRALRRQGIGSVLILASCKWATNAGSKYLVFEMQPKNFPAIQLAQKLGFEFCGFNDIYYPDHEIAIFFRKAI